jgi:hypothetical protein
MFGGINKEEGSTNSYCCSLFKKINLFYSFWVSKLLSYTVDVFYSKSLGYILELIIDIYIIILFFPN